MAIRSFRGYQIGAAELDETHLKSTAQIPESNLNIDWAAHETSALSGKKVLYKVQVNDVAAGGVSTLDVTETLIGAPVTSAGTNEGIVTDVPYNKALIRDGDTPDTPLKDANGNVVYGRVTTTATAITGEAAKGVIDGVNTSFETVNNNVQSASYTVYHNGVALTEGTDYTFDNLGNGTFTLVTAPASGDTVTADYTYDKFDLGLFVEDAGLETAFTTSTGQNIDYVYYKRGNLDTMPEDFVISGGGAFVEGATDAVADFNIKQLAKEIGVPLGNDGVQTLTRNVLDEIIYQTSGVTNTTERANAIIDEIVTARGTQTSLKAALDAISADLSTEVTNRQNADANLQTQIDDHETRITSLESDHHNHDRYLTEITNDTTSVVSLPTDANGVQKTADPNTLQVFVGGALNYPSVHYTEVTDVDGNVTGADFGSALPNGEDVMMFWKNFQPVS